MAKRLIGRPEPEILTVDREERELAALRRDAAISLLLEAPVECSERAPLPGACGRCWTCRVDKFLRDLGLRW